MRHHLDHVGAGLRSAIGSEDPALADHGRQRQMNIRGSRTLDAPREAVFAAICDPDVLLAVIPGCREIEQIGETEYRGQIALRLPGVAGT